MSHKRSYGTPIQETENLNVAHSRFLAEKNRTARWTRDDEDWGGETDLKDSEDFDSLAEGKGTWFMRPSSYFFVYEFVALGDQTNK